MSAQLRRKLRDATLECVKQYRSSHPGQTREQFKDESHELSKVFLNSRGIEFFTAEGAKWTWPRDRNIITDRVSEYLQTQNEYQKEKEGRNKRKFGEAEQSEEHEQERAKTRNRFSGNSSLPSANLSFTDLSHRHVTASRRLSKAANVLPKPKPCSCSCNCNCTNT